MMGVQEPGLPSTMWAAVWDGAVGLAVEQIPVPRPLANEVLIRVSACGVCHTDLHVMKGEVPFPAPAVLGHEVSGTVVATGPGVTSFALGDKVIGAFILPCGGCAQCEKGRDDLCATFFEQNRMRGNLLDGTSRLTRADGSRLSMYSMGGLAEYAVIPATAVARLPESLPLDRACVLGCAAFTAFGAVSASRLQPAEAVAVVAVGGVGSSIVQLAAHIGARQIMAVDISDEKLDRMRALGATSVVNSATEDVVQEGRRVAEAGFDVVFEALGRPETVQLGSQLLAAGGRLFVVGIASGSATAAIPITELVRRAQTIQGSFGARTRVDLPRVVQLAADGAFDLAGAVTRTYPLSRVEDAYRDLADGRISGRGIVVMEN